MWDTLFDVLIDSLLDTLKLLPFLLLIYIIIELIDRKSKFSTESSRLNGNLGVLIGSATGLIPQCGFSVMAAKLFDSGIIPAGTLLAIFISTSDEAFIILLSSGKGALSLLPMILIKIVVGVIVGYTVNIFAKHLQEKRQAQIKAEKADYRSRMFVKKEKVKDDGLYCSCGRKHDNSHPVMTYFVYPLLHSLKISVYVFVVTFIFGLLMAYFEEQVTSFLEGNIFLQPLVTSLIGLIPNCASSVVLTESYLLHKITFASCVAGLCSNAGLGFVVLLRNTKQWKRNLALVGGIYGIAVTTGELTTLILSAFNVLYI